MHLRETGDSVTTIALAGNPNCGKTTVFNMLTGSRHHVGNWPGVTVERRSGTLDLEKGPVEVVDLPGTYSLSAQSEDERIAADFLLDPQVDLILNVLDASNLERNLYFTSQLLELGKPIVFVLNMHDDALRAGITLDLPTMAALLGGAVVPTVGNRGEGLDDLRAAIDKALANLPSQTSEFRIPYGADLEREIARVEQEIRRDELLSQSLPPRWLAIHLLERAQTALTLVKASHARKAILDQLEASLAFLEPHLGADGATLVAEGRYGFAHGLVREIQQKADTTDRTLTSRLDAVLTHRWLGIPIFMLIMVAVYGVTFVLGKYPQDWIAAAFSTMRDHLGSLLPQGELSSLLVDGIIPGVGAVVVFVPIIMLLMGCIAFLEDTGYMARAAFIMDRIMHLMGLHGRSFIPLVMGTGCNVPAVQATRTIEARADRFITILVSPLVSCSARLQVYVLIAGAFFAPLQAACVMIGLHFLGFALAMIMGKLLRLAAFRDDQAPFVMELPPYRMPVLKSTFIHMWEKGSVFLSRAGTTILAGATFIWFVSHYPGIADGPSRHALQVEKAAISATQLSEEEKRAHMDRLDRARDSHIVNTSLAASFGRTIQPALDPILDPERKRPEAWKDAIALTAGFVAKEIVVSTLAVVHQVPVASEGGEATLRDALRQRSGMTRATALAFMVFTLLYTPCLGTVSMIFKETRSFAWTTFAVAYGLVLAWSLAWLTSNLARMGGW